MKNNDLTSLLKEIGLSEKESKMYLNLLHCGTSSISHVAKRGGFNRGTAYVVLHELLRQGFVTETIRSGVQYFTPLDPRKIPGILDHQGMILREKKQKIQDAISHFLTLQNPHSTQPRIQFFEGEEGARSIMEETLTSKEKTLRAFLSLSDIAAFVGGEYFSEYTHRRIGMGLTLHALRTEMKDKEAMKFDRYAESYRTSKKQKREVRYVPEELSFPITMYLFDERIAILSSREENFGLLIESRELSEMQKKMWEFFWKSSTTIPTK